MLKLLKFEIKRIAVFPLAVTLIGTLINIVLMIICGAAKPNGDNLLKYISTSNNFSEWTVILSGLIMLVILAANSLKEYSVYDLSNIGEKKLIATRVALLFIFVTFISLIMIAETTIIGTIVLNRMPPAVAETINPTTYYGASMCLVRRGFVSWLQPLAIGMFFIWAYALIISTAPLLRLTNGKFARFMIAVVVIALGVVIQIYVGGLFANACEAVNFNEYHNLTTSAGTGNGEFLVSYTDVPNGIVTAYQKQAQNLSYVTLNVLNLGLDLFILVQIICCIMMYGLRRTSLSKNSSKDNKRRLLQLILPACLIVFYVSFAPAVAIDKPYVDKLNAPVFEDEIPDDQMPVYYVPYNKEGIISVPMYVNIVEIWELPSRYEVTVRVVGRPFDKDSDKKSYSVGDGIELSQDYCIISVQNSGAYLYSVSLYNKLTHASNGFAVYFYYDAPK